MSGAVELCPSHKKKAKFLCEECNTLVCAECVTLPVHRGHAFVKPPNQPAQQVEKLYKPFEFNFVNAKKYAKKIQSIDKTITEISQFFKMIHESLFVEEHKLTKPINEVRQEIMNLLKMHIQPLQSQFTIIKAVEISMSSSSSSGSFDMGMINDVSNLDDNEYIKDPKYENINESDPNKQRYTLCKLTEVEEFIELLGNMEKSEQFLKNEDIIKTPTTKVTNDELVRSIGLAVQDNELLTKNLEKLLKEDPTDIKFEFKVNNAKLDKSISDIKGVYNLTQGSESAPIVATGTGSSSSGDTQAPQKPISSIGGYMKKYIEESTIFYIYVLCGMESTQHLSTVEVCDLKNDRWGVVEGTRMKRACSSASVACTNEHIFIFGGNDTLNTFERFNINTRKWDCLDSIPTKGGSSLACCYDNGRYIYLVGGIQNNITMDRIDKFDILTGKCVEVGKLIKPRYYTYCCFHDDIVYTVGGTFKEASAPYTLVNSIESYNTKDSTSKILLTFGGNERVEACTFDKREYIYFITCNVFCRFSILTNSIEKLSNPPLQEGKFGLAMVFGYFDTDFRIFLLGGKEENQYCFSISKGTWAPFKRKGKYTYFHGAVAVR